MAVFRRSNPYLMLSAALFLGACTEGFDVDMRDLSGGFDTTDATRLATVDRPTPDARGVITYPNFQVALAQNGDTIASVANRLGINGAELAAYNGIDANTVLREGEVVALPRGINPLAGGQNDVDIASLATGALDRAGPGQTPPRGNNSVQTTTLDTLPAAVPQSGPEPVRHKVKRGETAFQIARLYRVSARALADWNGLGPDMAIREGQVLLIPVAANEQTNDPTNTLDISSVPGEGTLTPEPPSATKPLPEENEVASVAPPPSPNLGNDRTEVSSGKLMLPVSGSIIRPYDKGRNEGIDIASSAGTKVRAADDGVVAAITKDTGDVPILVIRHANNLLTVYANIQNVPVSKGDKVTRGQTIAEVRDTSPAFLHFEVREGFDSVDPVPYVNP